MKILAYILGAALTLTSTAFAAEQPAMTPTPTKQPEMTPEQAAMRVLQQQRNQAAAQAADQQATMAYIQAEAAAKDKYWEAYVKGLAPKK